MDLILQYCTTGARISQEHQPCTSFALLARSYPVPFLAISGPQEVSPWSLIRVKLPQAEFKDNQGKMGWKNGTLLVNEGCYFEKAPTEKTDCELEDSDE